MIKLKDTVRPRSLVILAAAVNTHRGLQTLGTAGVPDDLMVTSGNDSKHMTGSKHYTNNAVDFRTKSFSAAAKRVFRERLAVRLGPNYQVLLEDEAGPNEHLHVEYRPEASDQGG